MSAAVGYSGPAPSLPRDGSNRFAGTYPFKYLYLAVVLVITYSSAKAKASASSLRSASTFPALPLAELGSGSTSMIAYLHIC
jgi:hypothetical protein